MSIQGFRNRLVVPAGPPALNFSHPAMGAGGKAARLVAVPNPGGGFLDLLTGKVSVTPLAGGTTTTTPTNIPGMGPAIHVPSITGGTQNTNIAFPSLIPSETSTSWMLAQIGRSTGSGGGGLTSLYFSAGNTTPAASLSLATTVLATGSGVTIGTVTIPQGHPVFAVVTRPVANNTCTLVVRDLVTGQIFVASAANNTTWLSTVANFSICGLGNTTALPTIADLGPAFIGVGFMPLAQLIAWAMDPWSLWYGRSSDVASITELSGPPPPAGFTTWNPSDLVGTTLSGGNLVATPATTGATGVRSVDRVYSGKYYWEITFTTTTNLSTGVATGYATFSGLNATGAGGAMCTNSGALWSNGTLTTNIGGTVTNGWVCCVALDATNGQVWFRNGAAGNWNGSATANPATGAGGISLLSHINASGPAFGLYAFEVAGGTGGVLTANFGASAFTGAVPSGFTSGFPSGTTLVNNEVVTQTAVEQWASITPPQMQLTQGAIEEWVTVNVTNPQMILTQAAIEEWATVANAVSVRAGGATLLAGL